MNIQGDLSVKTLEIDNVPVAITTSTFDNEDTIPTVKAIKAYLQLYYYPKVKVIDLGNDTSLELIMMLDGEFLIGSKDLGSKRLYEKSLMLQKAHSS